MPAKLDRCVKAVKAKGSAVNPWAVCKASLEKVKKKAIGHTRRIKRGNKAET